MVLVQILRCRIVNIPMNFFSLPKKWPHSGPLPPRKSPHITCKAGANIERFFSSHKNFFNKNFKKIQHFDIQMFINLFFAFPLFYALQIKKAKHYNVIFNNSFCWYF